MTDESSSIPPEVVLNKIYLIRGQKVMIDRDLADLYGIKTSRLKEQVRRNIDRFPKDFMFELSKDEMENWRSQNAISNTMKMGLRVRPFVFTEHGVLMLSSVLNNPRAIKVNIEIMRIFTKMKEMLLTHKDLLFKVEKIEKELAKQGKDIKVVFDYLNQFISTNNNPRPKIGYKK